MYYEINDNLYNPKDFKKIECDFGKSEYSFFLINDGNLPVLETVNIATGEEILKTLSVNDFFEIDDCIFNLNNIDKIANKDNINYILYKDNSVEKIDSNTAHKINLSLKVYKKNKEKEDLDIEF